MRFKLTPIAVGTACLLAACGDSLPDTPRYTPTTSRSEYKGFTCKDIRDIVVATSKSQDKAYFGYDVNDIKAVELVEDLRKFKPEPVGRWWVMRCRGLFEFSDGQTAWRDFGLRSESGTVYIYGHR